MRVRPKSPQQPGSKPVVGSLESRGLEVPLVPEARAGGVIAARNQGRPDRKGSGEDTEQLGVLEKRQVLRSIDLLCSSFSSSDTRMSFQSFTRDLQALFNDLGTRNTALS